MVAWLRANFWSVPGTEISSPSTADPAFCSARMAETISLVTRSSSCRKLVDDRGCVCVD